MSSVDDEKYPSSEVANETESQDRAKETIILLHGTYAGPRQDVSQWYAPGSDFCRQLDEFLAERGSKARCWAHLDDCGEELRHSAGRETPWFSWSGANSWTARTDAANKLLDELTLIAQRGWRWNLVAHSHGGNVALEAFGLDRVRAGLQGNVVLLGTPILSLGHSGKPVWQRGQTPVPWTRRTPSVPGRGLSLPRGFIGLGTSLLFWLLLLSMETNAANRSTWDLLIHGASFWIATMVATPLLAAAFWAMFIYGNILGDLLFEPHKALIQLTGGPTFTPRILFLNSAKDEAFNFLRAVLAAESPFLEVDKSIPSRGQDRLRSAVAFAMFHDRLEYPLNSRFMIYWLLVCLAFVTFGAVIAGSRGTDIPWWVRYFFSLSLMLWWLLLYIRPILLLTALSMPWRITVFCWRYSVSVIRISALGYVRRRLWRNLQGIALGLLGSPHRPKNVKVLLYPDDEYAGGEWLFEPLAPTAEAFAISEREKLVIGEWERVKLSSADLWVVELWREWVGMLAARTPLVHTIYYHHPDAIKQIAAHLARGDEELVALMKLRSAASQAPSPSASSFRVVRQGIGRWGWWLHSVCSRACGWVVRSTDL